jgi:hypothetical protein
MSVTEAYEVRIDQQPGFVYGISSFLQVRRSCELWSSVAQTLSRTRQQASEIAFAKDQVA